MKHVHIHAVGAVPIWIDIANRVQMTAAASASAAGSVVGPGFTFDNSITVGIIYSAANGWTTINERGVSFTQRAPSINLRGGTVTFTVTPILTIRFSLWSGWAIDLKLTPWISARLVYGASPCSTSVQLGMQVSLTTIMKGIHQCR